MDEMNFHLSHKATESLDALTTFIAAYRPHLESRSLSFIVKKLQITG